MKVKTLVIASVALAMSACASSPFRTTYGFVQEVEEGDKIVVTSGNKTHKVHLAYIDAPELFQKDGKKAKDATSRMLIGKRVLLVNVGKLDGMRHAEVILEDGVNASEELLKQGMVWADDRSNDYAVYRTLMMKAAQQKRGIWSNEDPESPWEWRKRTAGEE